MTFGYRTGDCSSTLTSDFVTGLALVGGSLDGTTFTRTPLAPGTYAFIAFYGGSTVYETGLACAEVTVAGTATLPPGVSPDPTVTAPPTLAPGATPGPTEDALPPWLVTPAPVTPDPGSGSGTPGDDQSAEPAGGPGSLDPGSAAAAPNSLVLFLLLAVLILGGLGIGIAARARTGQVSAAMSKRSREGRPEHGRRS
jgi:hypothetical protein